MMIIRRGAALAAAVGIGLSVVLLSVIFSVIVGSPINVREEIDILLIQFIIVSFPFLVLTLIGSDDLTVWSTGILLTLVIWTYLVFDAAEARREESGVNIGLALFMLVSPLLILAACLLVRSLRSSHHAKG